MSLEPRARLEDGPHRTHTKEVGVDGFISKNSQSRFWNDDEDAELTIQIPLYRWLRSRLK